MNTTDLIKQISERLSISRAEARRLLQQELDAMGQHLSEGRNIIIRGSGILGLRNIRAAKNNPNPGKTVFFKASQKLRTFVGSWRP